MIKTYRKIVKNPLGLAITTITNDKVKYPNGTFTDEDIDVKDKEKLALSIKSGMVEVVNTELEDSQAKEELAKSATELETANATILDLTKQLENTVDELTIADAKLVNSEELKAFAYELMNAEELAKFYTVDDLKEIATKLEIEFNATIKEAALSAKIVEKLG